MWNPFARNESKADRIKRHLTNMNINMDPHLLNDIDSSDERWRSFFNGLVIGLGVGAFLGLYLGVDTLRGKRY